MWTMPMRWTPRKPGNLQFQLGLARLTSKGKRIHRFVLAGGMRLNSDSKDVNHALLLIGTILSEEQTSDGVAVCISLEDCSLILGWQNRVHGFGTLCMHW
jgi:hypothetical protein